MLAHFETYECILFLDHCTKKEDVKEFLLKELSVAFESHANIHSHLASFYIAPLFLAVDFGFFPGVFASDGADKGLFPGASVIAVDSNSSNLQLVAG